LQQHGRKTITCRFELLVLYLLVLQEAFRTVKGKAKSTVGVSASASGKGCLATIAEWPDGGL
jgi:hypothetical protein